MKILYTNFHLGWGGQPYQVLLLSQAMRERGHEVLVCSPPESVLLERIAAAGLSGNAEMRFPRGLRPVRLYRDVCALRKLCYSFKPDIIHSHGSQDSWTLATALALPPGKGRTRVVRTKHNSYAPKPHLCNRWLFGSFFDSVIVVSEAQGAQLLEPGLIAPERLAVIPAACEVDRLMAQKLRPRGEVRAEFGISPDEPLVILVGRLAADKGQDMLLRAMPSLLKRVPKARAMLVGMGGFNETVQSIRKELNLGERVVMPGFRTDVADLTACADCAVLAATACDASSTVLKEAMALGVPVVGTDVGGTAGIVDHGRCGLLIKPGDPEALASALAETLLNRDGAQARAARAKEHVRQYSCANIATRTEELYARLLGKQ